MKYAAGRVLAAALPAFLGFMGSHVYAQQALTWSGQVGIATEGTSKDVAETAGRGQVKGAIEADYGPVFASASWRNLHEGAGIDGQQEYVLGVRGKVQGFDLSLSGGYKIKDHAPPGFDAHFIEYEGDIARTLSSGTTLRLTDVYTSDAPGPAKQDNFLEAGVSQSLSERWSVSGAIAVRNVTPKSHYNAMNLGVSYALRPKTSIDLRYYDTNQHALGSAFKPRLVMAVTQGF